MANKSGTPKIGYVYMLFDAIENCPIYVGATINLHKRFSEHRSTTIKNHKNKDSIIINHLEMVDIDILA